MFEAIDHTAKSSGTRTIASENTTVIKNSKTGVSEINPALRPEASIGGPFGKPHA
jgi:hypothetical protein